MISILHPPPPPTHTTMHLVPRPIDPCSYHDISIKLRNTLYVLYSNMAAASSVDHAHQHIILFAKYAVESFDIAIINYA